MSELCALSRRAGALRGGQCSFPFSARARRMCNLVASKMARQRIERTIIKAIDELDARGRLAGTPCSSEWPNRHSLRALLLSIVPLALYSNNLAAAVSSPRLASAAACPRLASGRAQVRVLRRAAAYSQDAATIRDVGGERELSRRSRRRRSLAALTSTTTRPSCSRTSAIRRGASTR